MPESERYQSSDNDRTILVVEDEECARRALVALLCASGYAADAVDSAEKALERVAEGHVPQVALVDVDLPGMSGMELIRRLEESNPSITSVLVTAAEADRVEDFCRIHLVEHVPKPVDFDQLLWVIDQTEGN